MEKQILLPRLENSRAGYLHVPRGLQNFLDVADNDHGFLRVEEGGGTTLTHILSSDTMEHKREA